MPVPATGFRARILTGERMALGWLDLGTPVTAEIAALSGFDALVIDREHGAGDDAAARAQILAAAQHVPVLVRLPGVGADPGTVLDQGAAGVLFPRGRATEEIAAAAARTRYAGARGVAPFARSVAFGAAALDGWRDDADASVGCIAQVETEEALERAEEIAALPDVDALFVGPADLSNALGCPLELDGDGPLVAAAQRVSAAAREHGKAAAIHLPSAELVPRWLAAGFSVISCSFESHLLAVASARAARELKEPFQGSL